MLYEKSCGFVVYKETDAGRQYLIIQVSHGEYGFPKGHMEAGETERETALREIREDVKLTIKDLTVNPMRISHDAAQPVGYRMECGGKSVGIATDLGKYNDYIVDNLQNLDVLLLEANHDVHMLQTGIYPYPLKQRILGDRGHLSNERSGQLLCELLHDNFGTVMLGHLSKENNYEELAYEAVRLEVTMGDNPYKAEDFPMMVANRDTVSPVIRVG